jgi:hypothetical protein
MAPDQLDGDDLVDVVPWFRATERIARGDQTPVAQLRP